MHQSENRHFDMLIQSLQLLAASFTEQIKALPPFTVIADEVALTFDDAWIFSNELINEGLITDTQVTAIRSLDDLLVQMSNNKGNWTLDALEHADIWEEVRKIASNILVSFGEEKKTPNLFWIQYIPNRKE